MFFFKSIAHFCPNLIFKKNCYFFLWFYKSSSWFFSQKQAGAELKQKKKFFLGPKLGKKFENKVQKLSNLKKKRTFRAKKNKLGLSLGKQLGNQIEKRGQKLTNSKKRREKRLFRPKKQAGAELKKRKKDFLGPKLGKNFRIKSRNKLI